MGKKYYILLSPFKEFKFSLNRSICTYLIFKSVVISILFEYRSLQYNVNFYFCSFIYCTLISQYSNKIYSHPSKMPNGEIPGSEHYFICVSLIFSLCILFQSVHSFSFRPFTFNFKLFIFISSQFQF